MEQTEVTLGEATYTVSRVYVGPRTVDELLLDRLTGQVENSPFDGDTNPAV